MTFLVFLIFVLLVAFWLLVSVGVFAEEVNRSSDGGFGVILIALFWPIKFGRHIDRE